MAAIDEKEYTQSFDWKIWKRLGPFLRPYRGAFVSMLVFNGICALVDVVLPLFQKYAIQNFIEKNTLTGLLPYALAYLAVVVVQALSVVAFARNSMHIEMNLGKDMRGTLFHHLQTLSFSFYNVTPVGYLLTRVMSDTNRISGMLAWNFTDILWAMFYVLGTFAAMLALNWRLALAVIAIVPVMAILTGYFQNRILHWNRKVRKLNSRITGAFNEGITGARTTKTLVTEEQTAGRCTPPAFGQPGSMRCLSRWCCSSAPWRCLSCCCGAAIWCWIRRWNWPLCRPLPPMPSVSSTPSR